MPAQIVMNPAQWAAYMNRLGQSFMPAMLRGLQVGVQHRCRDHMIYRTSMAPPASDRGSPGAVNYGTYKAAWKSILTATGAILLNDMAYSGVIEFGRRASPVSRAGRVSLARWAQRKLGLSPEEAVAASYALAQSLAKRPLRGRRVMTDGLDEMTKMVVDEITHELDVELRKP